MAQVITPIKFICDRCEVVEEVSVSYPMLLPSSPPGWGKYLGFDLCSACNKEAVEWSRRTIQEWVKKGKG